MVGPILGSGIIILPPLVFSIAGNWAFPAWCLIVFLGFFFAQIFGKLTIMFPGDTGVSQAIEHAFGSKVKIITSFYLIGAVLFGPAAVILTAAQYIPGNYHIALLAIPITLVSSALLLREAAFIGRISLVLSTFAAGSLLIGSLLTLGGDTTVSAFTLPPFDANQFGYTMLLLFWTIVGWEVVGNYSGDVINPEKNIIKAVYFSIIIIALISLAVAAAIQVATPQIADGGITAILYPLFGSLSTEVMALLTLALCVTTYLMFVGGVARLICAVSYEKMLPGFLGKRSATGAPIGAILFLTGFYIFVFLATYIDIVNVTQLVALADGFFIANALIGLFTAIKIIPGIVTRSITTLLALIFIAILLHSSLWVLLVIALLPFWVYWKNRKTLDRSST